MNRISTLAIEEILAQFDVERLIAAGAPQDEYSAEAKELANEISEGASYQQVEKALTEIFHNYFDFAYVLSDDPDEIAFTKHAIDKFNFSADPTGLNLTLKSQSDSKVERASSIRGAAYAISQLLKHFEQNAEDVTIKMTYKAPNDGVEAQACLFLTDSNPNAVVRQVTIPALDTYGVERGKFTLQFDAAGTLLAIQVYGAITALPRDLLNKVWSAKSSIDLDPETLRNS